MKKHLLKTLQIALYVLLFAGGGPYMFSNFAKRG